MLLSILANLIGLYGLIALPVIITQTIDVSRYQETGQISLLERIHQPGAPIRKNNKSLGIEITAGSAIIADKKTGMILWQKNPAEVRPLASLTKLMSALVFLNNNPGWETEVTILTSDYREGGRIYVYPGEKISAKDLFYASLVASSNNATVALARSTGLTAEEFVQQMNETARQLGLAQSHFIEPTGLDPQNATTADDLLKLIHAAFSRPEIIQATSQAEYSFKVINAPRNYTLKNTDKLLSGYLNILAGKTGYLDEAGYCLASLVKGQDGQEIYIVVLGSDSETNRFQEVKALAQWAFDNYIW